MRKFRRTFNWGVVVCTLTLSLGLAAGAAGQNTAPVPHDAAPTPALEWKTYAYSADGFSASFPSEPDRQKRNIPTDAGSFELRSYVAQVAPVAVFVGVCDYGSAAASKDPGEMLDGAKNGALTNSSSHLLREQKITLGVYHGVAFESESETAHFTARIYIVGTTLYQTLVVAPIGQPFSGTARFLDSFQFIARVQN